MASRAHDVAAGKTTADFSLCHFLNETGSIYRVGQLTLQKPDVANISPEFRAFSLPPLHSSRRAVQFSPILGPVRRFGAQNACMSSQFLATSGKCNVGSHYITLLINMPIGLFTLWSFWTFKGISRVRQWLFIVFKGI